MCVCVHSAIWFAKWSCRKSTFIKRIYIYIAPSYTYLHMYVVSRYLTDENLFVYYVRKNVLFVYITNG